MSWVTVIWSMGAGSSLTLAGVYLLVWARNRSAWPSFFFSLIAVGSAGLAFCELGMMHAQTPEAFIVAHRGGHVAIWLITVSLVGFVYTFLRPRHAWLAWTVVALRSAALLLNFTTGASLNYAQVHSLQRISFLGEPVSIAIGTPNPWMLVGNLCILLLLIFVADASATAWRRGQQGTALRVGGTTMFFALAGVMQAVLVFWWGVKIPITISLFSLGVLLAMAYELIRDVLRASALVTELQKASSA